MLGRSLVLGMLLGTLCVADQAVATTQKNEVNAKVVYGEDNRLDLFQVTNAMHVDLADSTVALIKSTDLTDMGNGMTGISGRSFGETFNLCSSEPFREQKSASFCSGFLVNEDTVVTAGHCVQTAKDCSAIKFVFTYHIRDQALGTPSSLRSEEVYGCQNLIYREQVDTGADFAVVKLDRRVLNHRPLEIRREGAPSVGDPLVVIGYPSGLPVKVAAGAKVRSIALRHFVANLDTYGGNSGSSVFNDNDGKVEGILVRGERDFVYQGGCAVSNRCTADGCRGEDVTRISAVLPYLN